MLRLINEARGKVGVDRLRLGTNQAAQVHAESSLDGCYTGHWGEDGLKPYMRYNLKGGYQFNKENVSGHHFCHLDPLPFPSLQEALVDAMNGLMDSPGHRRNILAPNFKAVSLGVAWDLNFNLVVVQQFEGDYVEYGVLPTIDSGELSMAGTAVGGAGFRSADDLVIGVNWDPPPHQLTQGQLSRTYCYDQGRLVAGIGLSSRKRETVSYTTCPDPYLDFVQNIDK